MQCAMQMCHSESKAEISVVTTAGDEICPGGGLCATGQGLCHALLGSAARLDLVSGNCILSELSVFELDAGEKNKERQLF